MLQTVSKSKIQSGEIRVPNAIAKKHPEKARLLDKVVA